MNKLYFIFLLSTGLTLGSCIKNNKLADWKKERLSEIEDRSQPLSPDSKEYIANRCIQPGLFAQGQDHNLYGKECIEGRHILIQTSKEGTPITKSTLNTEDDKANIIRLEGRLSFMNEVYDLKYKIQKGEGHDYRIHFLRSFLPENEHFLGSKNTKYNIIFKTEGNFLILYKASTDIDHLPYMERTSMKTVTTKKGVNFYIVPFLGYPIEYCIDEPILNNEDQETEKNRIKCGNDFKKTADYFRIVKEQKRPYKYKDKIGFFHSNYFDGEWFYSRGWIETADRVSEIAPFSTSLVKFTRTSKSLNVVDYSGDREERTRVSIDSVPVVWLNYEMDKNGDTFNSFGERISLRDYYNIKTQNPYLEINLQHYIDEDSEPLDFLISENYFSITFMKIEEYGQRKKEKTFFL